MSTNVDTEGVDQLVDDKVSCDRHMMWSTCLPSEGEVSIKISLTHTHSLGGLKIWNYNESPDGCYKGVSIDLSIG